MKSVVKPHEVTETEGDIERHLHHTHHVPWALIYDRPDDEIDLLHADDHDDLRRGIHAGP